MPGLDSLIVIAASAIIGIAIVAGAAAWCWKAWIDLKRAELGAAPARVSSTTNRIDVADLKERVRKLEAIAAGVDY